MIRYALACDQGHAFESWFPSGAAYEEQAQRGLVSCPACGSAKVGKQLMAPSIARRDREAAQVPALAEPPPAADTAPVALLSERERQLRAMLREIRDHVTKNAEHVGARFVEEARKMHYGETEHRSIYGEASLDEARALLEEGVDVQPLPMIADDRN